MAATRVDGILTAWNDDRGFGFITPEGEKQDLFVHISAFGSIYGRPEVGDRVNFQRGADKSGRPQARNVVGQNPKAKVARPAGPASLIVVALFVALYIVVDILWPVPLWVLAAYVGMSILTAIFYWVDKSRAAAGGWRIPEQTLLVLGLLCGWPGAVIAQQVLRHKTVKVSFRVQFWLSVVGNVGVFALLATRGLIPG